MSRSRSTTLAFTLPLGKWPLLIGRAHILAHQQRQRLIHLSYSIDVEALLAYGLQHALIEHEGGDVGERDDHPCSPVRPRALAEAEEAFDLLVDPADRLHFTELVDRAGDGEALLERCARQRRDQRTALAQRGAVAVDVTVVLFQRDARGNLQETPGRSGCPGSQ